MAEPSPSTMTPGLVCVGLTVAALLGALLAPLSHPQGVAGYVGPVASPTTVSATTRPMAARAVRSSLPYMGTVSGDRPSVAAAPLRSSSEPQGSPHNDVESQPHAVPLALLGLAGLPAAAMALYQWLSPKRTQTGSSALPLQPVVAAPMTRRDLLASAALLGTAGPAWALDDPPKRRVYTKEEEEAQLKQFNERIQRINRVPEGFPTFVRDGYDVKIVNLAPGYKTLPSGLVVYDFSFGNSEGPTPVDGQKVIFNYTAYNENGARIDSSYSKGRPLEQIVGIGGMVPGFEEGIKGMHVGGQRRIIIPPELGPPVGPSTFFSAKQFEVFDVELVDILQCNREGFAMTSRVVCTSPTA